MNRRSIAFAAWCLFICFTGPLAKAIDPPVHSQDSLETVKKNLESGKAVLVDVREPNEWEAGHLKSASHLPLKSIFKGLTDEQVKQALPEDKIIYFHCAAGVRSLDAARKLAGRHPDMRPLKPGYDSLIKAGFEKAD